MFCPICQPANETAPPSPATPEKSPVPAPAELPTESYQPAGIANSSTRTDPFAQGVVQVAQASEPDISVKALTGALRSLTATASDVTERVRVPFAPPGFDLLRKLGSGGMGDVYLVREQVSERTVAMKFLRSPGNSAALDRFIDEIRALARINHPNIVRFYWEDYNRDRPFFTMEYAAGGSLADRVSASGPLPPLDAAELIATAARAVHAAHAVNVLHRDLKPSNILLAADGSVKVSDFSLAKLTDRDDENTGAELLGTPGFMPPEQIARDRGPVGTGSDVYGLGATLYYLLTGRAPFVGETKMDIVAQVERDLPDRPRRRRPEIPMALEAVTLKCLEKNPTNRYSNAFELADELDRFRAGLGTKVLPLTPLRRARRWVVWNRKLIGLVVLAVVIAIGLFAVGRQFRNGPPPDPEQVIREEIASGKEVRLLDAQGRPRVAIWPLSPAELTCSPDGGGTCTFESEDSNVVLLLRDPGVDSYRLRAKVEQTVKAGHKLGLINALDNEVGLVVGYAGQIGPNGRPGYALMALSFREYEPAGRKEQRKLTLTAVGGTTAAGFELARYWKNRLINTGQKFDPPGKDSPSFRDLEVLVSPDGIRITGDDGKPKLVPAARIQEIWKEKESELTAQLGDLAGPLTGWSPRMPIGIWAAGSKVSFSDVTIKSVPYSQPFSGEQP